jgi:nucleoside diphosphate kinase
MPNFINLPQGAAVAAVLEGNEAQLKVRTACGATMPNRAAPWTIRFDYSCDSPTAANDEQRPVFNLIMPRTLRRTGMERAQPNMRSA